MNESREKWLSELKVGDEVCIQSSGTLGQHHEITKISKKTPTRKFRVNNYLFDKMGECSIGWTYYSIIPATQEVKQGIKDRNVRYRVKQTDFDSLQQDKINRIYAIILEEVRT